MSLFQSLEARRLLAAAPVSTDAGDVTYVKLSHTGTLQVTGTSGKDKIELSRDVNTGAIVVKVPSSGTVFQGSYGVLKTGGFDPKLIKRIKVDGGGNGDVINYNVPGKFVTATLNGGKGDDRITTLGVNTIVNGGSGDDTLASQTGPLLFTIAPDGTYMNYQLVSGDNGSVTISPLFNSRVTNGTLTRTTFADLTRDAGGRFVISDGNAITRDIVSTDFNGFHLATPIGGNSIFNASGNRLDGGDGDDTFNSYGTEDSIIGGNGNDSYTAPAGGIDVYDTDLTPIAVTKDVLTIRSRLSAVGVENITTNVSKTKGGITVKAGTLADLA